MKLLLVVLFLLSPAALAKQSITWLLLDAPPFSMPDDSPIDGVCDRVVDEVIKRTPQFEHRRQRVPQARIRQALQDGKAVCHPCMIKRANSALVRYSLPTQIYPPLRVITTTEQQQTLTRAHGNPISLHSLFADPALRYGQSVARKYSDAIELLKENIQTRQAITLNYRGQDQAAALGDMLHNKRIDYGIDYPFVADYYNDISAAKVLATTNISGVMDELVNGAIGCAEKANNDFAKDVLEVINSILTEEILPSLDYRQHQERWLGHYFENFNASYEQHILTKKPATMAGSKVLK
ncbi:hypothetical protein [Pseudoalteromonas sp. BDTF-M6]|uniref:hypothetical protein n=1 Tax=Pseudoalteromonas sp. BDTF-M6 TaxID=2796132 RepID=UPI001BAEE6EE|nr:hypothetical protein [Pseudoalteromonas sp. BDTF-M6]MBS3798933.1 hypothetical protein [Pseudoalteromonas sp. BDTF-M6]